MNDDIRAGLQDLAGAILVAAGREVLQREILSLDQQPTGVQALGLGAMTVEKLADQLGLEIREPNRMRGQYFGQVRGLDHRAWLIQYSNTQAIELPFEVCQGSQQPRMGDSIRMSYQDGALAISIQVSFRNARIDREKQG